MRVGMLPAEGRLIISPKSVNVEKLQTIAEQSCKQCGRSIPLSVSITNKQPAEVFDGFNHVFFADETMSGDDVTLESKLAPAIQPDKTARYAIVVGAEGGFTEKEREKITAEKNIVSVSLGRRILRAETAVISLAAVVLAKMGEL